MVPGHGEKIKNMILKSKVFPMVFDHDLGLVSLYICGRSALSASSWETCGVACPKLCRTWWLAMRGAPVVCCSSFGDRRRPMWQIRGIWKDDFCNDLKQSIAGLIASKSKVSASWSLLRKRYVLQLSCGEVPFCMDECKSLQPHHFTASEQFYTALGSTL